MKTISKREGKNYEIEVKGDLHQYLDGSVHTVKNGKAIWEEGSGGSGSAVYATFEKEIEDKPQLVGSESTWLCDKTFEELKAAYDAGLIIFAVYNDTLAPMVHKFESDPNDESVEMFVANITTCQVSSSDITYLKYYQFAVADSYGVMVKEATRSFVSSDGPGEAITK